MYIYIYIDSYLYIPGYRCSILRFEFSCVGSTGDSNKLLRRLGFWGRVADREGNTLGSEETWFIAYSLEFGV